MSGATTWSHSSTARSPTSSSSSSSSSSIMPSPTAPSLQPTTRGIDLGGWSVRVTSGPIGSSAEMDALSDILGIPPPEMAFPHNSLVLHHAESGFSLCFDAVRTLRSIDGVKSENRLYGVDCRDAPSASGKATKSGGSVPGAKPKAKQSASIKVAYAKEWGKSRTDFVASEEATQAPGGDASPAIGGSHFGVSTADITAAKDYDWTYSSTWAGALGDISPQALLPTQSTPSLATGLKPLSQPPTPQAQDQEWFEPGTDPARDRIPVERLGPSSGEPILFYDDIVLYEDELADNGSSIVNVKVRVMPSGFLVLQRFFLRVDDVLFRVFDTRLYCQFAPAPVPRSVATSRPAVTNVLPTSLNQLNLGSPRSVAAAAAAPFKTRDGDVTMSTSTNEEEEHFVPRLIRECSGSEATYAQVRAHLPPYKPHDLSPLTDMNWVSATLTKISRSQLSSYHAGVASGTTLPRLGDKDASPGAKFLAPTTAASRYPGSTGFPGARPGEKLDLSPATAPPFGNMATTSAQIVGQLQQEFDDQGREEWAGCGARVDVAVLRPKH
ncbi:related to TIP41 - negatively regulates the TOR signaling pathway [Ustilago trichophora]|uniref:Related to TIP41 - negatively regulates the TOR signaling pathway n=1 Tax=Ustilago trichophora TaxID=86804 RepID=A0A5C3DYN5_9BASI|nr:related to TIP41 - negatively regulates the TOR signaling pathway [Ustilago trichophora]